MGNTTHHTLKRVSNLQQGGVCLMSRCVNELQVNRLYYRHATLKELKRSRADRKIVNSVKRTTDPFEIGGILIEAHLFEVLVRVYELNDAMTVFRDFRTKKYEAVVKEFEEADSTILADFDKFMESEKNVCNNMSPDEAVDYYFPAISKRLDEQASIAHNKLQAVCKENRELTLMFVEAVKNVTEQLRLEVAEAQKEMEEIDSKIKELEKLKESQKSKKSKKSDS